MRVVSSWRSGPDDPPGCYGVVVDNEGAEYLLVEPVEVTIDRDGAEYHVSARTVEDMVRLGWLVAHDGGSS